MQTSQPLISVVIATYNGEKFLSRQIESVLQQTYRNLEIIITDDASTDGTWNCIQEYTHKDQRIQALRSEKNLGYVKNFEKGIRFSKGEYIAICDQDDIWHAEKISKLFAAIQHHSLAFSDSELVNEEGQSLGKKLSDIKQLDAYTSCLPFVPGNCISGHACLIKRDMLLQALPFPSFFVYDWYLAFFICCAGRIVYINEPLVQYRQHSQSSIAAVKVKGNKKKKQNQQEAIRGIRERIAVFYHITQQFNVHEQTILKGLYESYQSFSVWNNIKRSYLFFKYRNELLAIKKRSAFRKWLFCLKMFFKVI
ncbi:MAG: glycosyltransferase family 2 protein [Bacteroidota bacterium]|nr:glycosyltransferase family 2 protein [Bacteroidota bacterium]